MSAPLWTNYLTAEFAVTGSNEGVSSVDPLGSVTPSTIQGLAIKYLGTFGENWFNVRLGIAGNEQIGTEAEVKVTVDGFGSQTFTWSGDRYGYGNLIEVNHGNGYTTRYGHNAKLLVDVGDSVVKGQSISTMGSTGRSTGPHVHFEVLKNDRQINPSKFVALK